MQKNCIDRFDEMNCRAAVAFCDDELSTGMWASGKTDSFCCIYYDLMILAQGRNYYDISKVSLTV